MSAAVSHEGVTSVPPCPGCVLCAAEVWRDTSVPAVLCARVPCSGCPVCAPERRALTERLATPDDTATLLRAEVLRLAPQLRLDVSDLSAHPCTRTWWEWLALQLRSDGAADILAAQRARHSVANACEVAACAGYHSAAAMLALASGETVPEWRARVRAQVGGAT